MTSKQTAKVVTLPASAFLLEVHSERMVDVMHALSDAGFRVAHVKNTTNRFRVEDVQEQAE